MLKYVSIMMKVDWISTMVFWNLEKLGGLWKNVAGRYEIDGKKIYAKQILANPEEYFTPEVMQALDETARKEFSYG
jgi:hypothetical protein